MRYRIRKVSSQQMMYDVHLLDDRLFGRGPREPRLETHGTEWWVAYDRGGRAVAYAGLTLGPGGTCHLNRSGVSHSARGAGLQRRLIAVRERRARALGYARVRTTCASWNVASLANLLRSGYRITNASAFEPPRRHHRLEKRLR